MSREFSTFMDGDDCPECKYYDKRITQLEAQLSEYDYQLDVKHKRIEELESVMRRIKHLIETRNLNTAITILTEFIFWEDI